MMLKSTKGLAGVSQYLFSRITSTNTNTSISTFSTCMPRSPRIVNGCVSQRSVLCLGRGIEGVGVNALYGKRTRFYSSSSSLNSLFSDKGGEGGISSPVSRKKKKSSVSDADTPLSSDTTSTSSQLRHIASAKEWDVIAQEALETIETALGAY